MVHCSIDGCKKKQANNSEVADFSLPKDPQCHWLAAISRDKSNLPSNVFVCLEHFEDKYFDKSWDLQTAFFYTNRPIKRKSISTAIPTLPHKQIPTPRKTSEIRAKQNKKRRGKTLKQGLDIINLMGFKEIFKKISTWHCCKRRNSGKEFFWY